ncbi:hypothetical protein [Paraburkholderia sp. DGU8]|uniref:hypothetical protein n=1 Tax=Paraburkholderia sp. DGU8 TaxID=3161997 RepID=UPI0034660648
MKPSFFTNDVLAEIDPLGRILFQGLWCLADREGRLEDRPKKIKAELLPYDNCEADSLLQELADREFILRYEASGKRFIQVLNFARHQNPHCKEAASSIPSPFEHRTGTVQVSEIPAGARLIPDSLNLIPDSGFQDETPEANPTPPLEEKQNASSSADRSVEIAVYLRKRGISGANSMNPNIAAWGDDIRVTNEILDAALSMVASRKLDRAPGPNYLAPIVADLLNPRAAGKPRAGGLNKQESLEERNRAVAQQFIAEMSHANH